MKDLHCHILTGLDDGAQDLQEALEMARIAVADGITDIVATPHTHNGVYKNSADTVIEAVKQFQATLAEVGIPLHVHAGSEVHIHLEMLENLQRGQVLTIGNGSTYVLVELPMLNLPKFTGDLLQELQMEGFTPLIAHPERNVALRREPAILANWIEQGVVAQLTAGALLGQMGKRMRAFATYLVQNRLVHVLASDAHNSCTRNPKLKDAYQMLANVTEEGELLLFLGNAEAILQGKPCIVREPFSECKRRRFRWF